MPEEKNEGRPGMPCGLPKSGNACMNRTTACCLKCGWNPDEQVRRRALPLVKGEDGSTTRISARNHRQSAGEPYFIRLMPQALRHEAAAEGKVPGFAPGARQIPQARAPGKRVRRAQKRHPTRGIA